VEAALRDHEAIADVAVVGIPSDDYGEIVGAVVVLQATVDPPTLEELRAFATGRVASFKLPRRLEIVEAIPRTAATGQVQRHLVLELLAQLTARPRPSQ